MKIFYKKSRYISGFYKNSQIMKSDDFREFKN